MELLSSSKVLIPSAQTTMFPATYWMKTLQSRTTAFGNNFPYFRPMIRSKKSSYQDFQEYAKPSRLLPATEVMISTDSSVEKAVDSFPSGRSKSLYKVKLQTSKIYGSGLTDANCGILVCLIGENGSSILQRLPAILAGSDSRSEDKAMYDTVHFQRGSVDEFAFEGPNLGRIAAVWTGLESAKPCIKPGKGILLHRRTTSARTQFAIAVPKRRNKELSHTGLSVDGIPCNDLFVHEVVQRQSQKTGATSVDSRPKPKFHPAFLDEAYERCRNICGEYAKTFYLGTLLMTEERQKAIWAIYVWCRRTDELVDGPNAAHLSSAVLDRWEERLDDIYKGHPYDMLDAALTDTVHKFPLDIKPFKDMIEGMRMDTKKNRYGNFQELYLYCYYVAGTVGLMSVPVMGIAPESSHSAQSIYNAAIHLGIGNQLTNILRDVGEDASRGRVYLPQDELAKFGLCDKDVFARKVTDGWREFMKDQIRRARFYFDMAEEGATQLHEASRWPVWSSLMLYRMILDSIENNGYDNLTKRAYVGRAKKLMALPIAYTRAIASPTSVFP